MRTTQFHVIESGIPNIVREEMISLSLHSFKKKNYEMHVSVSGTATFIKA